MNTRQTSILLLLGAVTLTGVSMPRKGSREVITSEGYYSIPVDGERRVVVDALSDDIFRVATIPSLVPLKLPKSQGAVMKRQEAHLTATALPGKFLISSPTTTVVVDRHTGRVEFRRPDGSLMLAEARPLNNDGDLKSAAFVRPEGETLYGGGERGSSPNISGLDSLTFYNRQNYGYTGGDPRITQMGISVPLISSDAGWGVLFDDYNRASLALGDTISYLSETPESISYYFINGGDDLAGVTSGFTALTGRQDLPPFWTMGYVTSKYGYHNQQEALGAIDSLKRDGYPVDGIVFDLYWYGKETDMGRLEWNKEQFPDHKGMLDSLRRMGVNTVLISQPYINKIGAIDNYNMLSAKGMLARDEAGNTHDVTTWVGDAGMFDVSNPETREWLWNRLSGLTAEGLAGWWGDLGEPEVHPLTIMHANGQSASQYHNVYGNEWSRLIYEGLRRDFPQMRPMLMMRGGTTGLQRYSVFPWTTDVSRSWGGMEPQINLMLSSGLSGLAYMSSDLGGFAVDPKNPTDPELYVRWVQMGAFTPFMRTHAQLKPEPYHYPEQEDITRKYVKMRYEWLPYNYTLAYENASQGLPLARPLNFRGENPEKKYVDDPTEYLWGDNVLVAPVFRKGARSRNVTFPAGEWYDWWNPSQAYAGGTTAPVKAPLERLPLFVKAGSFIPQAEGEMQNTGDYDPKRLTVVYFPSKEETSYTLFDDDRKSPTSLQDGNYQLTTFTGRSEKGVTEISMRTNHGFYEGMPPYREITFEVRRVMKAPTEVTLSDGSPMPKAAKADAIGRTGWHYDAATHTLTVRVPWTYEPLSISIR